MKLSVELEGALTPGSMAILLNAVASAVEGLPDDTDVAFAYRYADNAWQCALGEDGSWSIDRPTPLSALHSARAGEYA